MTYEYVTGCLPKPQIPYQMTFANTYIQHTVTNMGYCKQCF